MDGFESVSHNCPSHHLTWLQRLAALDSDSLAAGAQSDITRSINGNQDSLTNQNKSREHNQNKSGEYDDDTLMHVSDSILDELPEDIRLELRNERERIKRRKDESHCCGVDSSAGTSSSGNVDSLHAEPFRQTAAPQQQTAPYVVGENVKYVTRKSQSDAFSESLPALDSSLTYLSIEPAKIIGVHFDDFPDVYYTIRIDSSGAEKQTTGCRLRKASAALPHRYACTNSVLTQY